MRKTTIAILLILTCATLLLAQTAPTNAPQPPDPATMAQRRVQHLTTLLNLSAAQQQQATTIFTNAATAASAARNNMRSAHQALATAVKNNDAAAIDQAAAAIGTLTAQMTSAEAKANAAFYQILTPDQQSKLSQLEAERPGFGLGMGPGGMGPRGMGRRGMGPRGGGFGPPPR
jgi:Spy/CpxP family protein refolding chaperone